MTSTIVNLLCKTILQTPTEFRAVMIDHLVEAPECQLDPRRTRRIRELRGQLN